MYNYLDGPTGRYSTSGDGFFSGTVGTNGISLTRTITNNQSSFEGASGNWKIEITASTQNAPFDLNVDLVGIKAGEDKYALDLQEQWQFVNYDEDLCLYTGSLSPNENLEVDVWTQTGWVTLWTLKASDSNSLKNASNSPYLSGPTFTLRFKSSGNTANTVANSWEIDSLALVEKSTPSDKVYIPLYNTGKIDISITSVYVNDLLMPSESSTIQVGEHGYVIVNLQWETSTDYRLRLVTNRGTEITGEFYSPDSG